jgi:hypothetical protein
MSLPSNAPSANCSSGPERYGAKENLQPRLCCKPVPRFGARLASPSAAWWLPERPV